MTMDTNQYIEYDSRLMKSHAQDNQAMLGNSC